MGDKLDLKGKASAFAALPSMQTNVSPTPRKKPLFKPARNHGFEMAKYIRV
jgi:hypothetical protein